MTMKHLLGIILILSLFQGNVMAQTNAKPFVIPELTSWKGAEGDFTPSGRIVVKSKQLREVAQSFVADYKEMFGTTLKVVNGKPQSGDFVFTLNNNKILGNEGYTLTVGNIATIAANTPQGAYWGTRTILQISEQSNAHTLPKAETTDIPRYQLRGFLFDVARKYIPMDYMHNLVKVMAYYKMNCLQVHLNDNGFKQYFENDWSKTSSAFRLESTTFPTLATKGASYSKQQFIDFQKMAEKHFVEIIPEIDVPAHSLAFTHLKPEIGSKEYGMDHLDLFKSETYEFVDALFKEYLEGPNPVFRGKRVNIGTDEYSNAKEEVREKFRYFTDRYIKYVQSFGKQVCLWGSLTHAYGKTPVTSKDVVMMCWNNRFANPKDMKEQGYQLVSIPDGYTYIVPAAGYYYDYLNTEYLYKSWTPAQIGNQKFEDGDPAILGGMFAVWNDHYGNGISVKDIHHRTMPALQMISLKTWTAHNTTIPFAEYNKLRHLLSEAPGVNELARWGNTSQLVYSQDEVKAGSTLPREEIGYNYSVAFKLQCSTESKGTELFCSANAVFYIADPKEGKVGFARDGYLNTFNYRLPKEGVVELMIQGTNTETRLYVNGKLRETLAPQTVYVPTDKDKLDAQYNTPDPFAPTVYRQGAKMHYQRTLVFPLRKAGNFRSKLTHFAVHNDAEVRPETAK